MTKPKRKKCTDSVGRFLSLCNRAISGGASTRNWRRATTPLPSTLPQESQALAKTIIAALRTAQESFETHKAIREKSNAHSSEVGRLTGENLAMQQQVKQKDAALDGVHHLVSRCVEMLKTGDTSNQFLTQLKACTSGQGSGLAEELVVQIIRANTVLLNQREALRRKDEALFSGKPSTPTQERIIQKCNQIRDLLLEKNRAYGDSALKPQGVFAHGKASDLIRVRIDDKLARIKNGAKGEDSEADLMGYLVLLALAKEDEAAASGATNA